MANPRQRTGISNTPALPDKPAGLRSKSPPLADKLLQLNDDFTEFSEISAFLCHGFTAALSDHESLNQDVIAGAKRCSNWLQFRSEELKEAFQHVHAGYAAEHEQKAPS